MHTVQFRKQSVYLLGFFVAFTYIPLILLFWTNSTNKTDSDFETSAARSTNITDITVCPDIPLDTDGNDVSIDDSISLPLAESSLRTSVIHGGSFKPSCLPRWNIAIVVPYRKREQHLGPFHNHMHKFLQKQHIQYTFFIVNQTDSLPFNRAMLLNIGYVEAQRLATSLNYRPFDCFVYHDVDFLPLDGRHAYNCADMPRHMTVQYKHPYQNDKDFERYFGGVVMLTASHMDLINGWSNSFWGWGGEDDDIKRRILAHNLRIWSYPKEIGRYTMLKHKDAPKNKQRYEILKTAEKRMESDGLNSLRYKLTSIIQYPLFTSFNVILEK